MGENVVKMLILGLAWSGSGILSVCKCPGAATAGGLGYQASFSTLAAHENHLGALYTY